jgi:hypothetical protein
VNRWQPGSMIHHAAAWELEDCRRGPKLSYRGRDPAQRRSRALVQCGPRHQYNSNSHVQKVTVWAWDGHVLLQRLARDETIGKERGLGVILGQAVLDVSDMNSNERVCSLAKSPANAFGYDTVSVYQRKGGNCESSWKAGVASAQKSTLAA